jgi:hypothetical protein
MTKFIMAAKASVGRAMAHVVSLWQITAEAQVCVRVSPCGICGGQSVALGQVFLSSLVFHYQYHSTMALCSHISGG